MQPPVVPSRKSCVISLYAVAAVPGVLFTNNSNGRIAVHRTPIKLFGRWDRRRQNNLKTVGKKWRFSLFGSPSFPLGFVLYFFGGFIGFILHAFTDFTQIHVLAALLRQHRNKNTIWLVATRLCKREVLRCSPCRPLVFTINKLQNSTIIQWIGFLIQFCYMEPSCTLDDSNA